MDHERSAPLAASRGTVLVTGAAGFIAGFIIAALREAGWQVIRGERRPRAGDAGARACDFSAPLQVDALLDGVEAVVNVAGILRESRGQSFERVHHDAPLQLAQGCVARGVAVFVQVSALGAAQDGAFITSKHRFDHVLLALPLRAVVLRPSVVYSASGSYGGTSLLRALAALPRVLPLPGDGRWRIQPAAAEDLAQLVCIALQRELRGVYEVGSAEAVTLRDYLLRWRAWLRLPRARPLHLPLPLVDAAVALGETLARGPLSAVIWRMLKRGNVADPHAHAQLVEAFGFAPRALDDVLAARPSQVQDRWHAQLYLLAPLLRAGVVLLFGLSAWAGFATPAATIEAMVQGSLLQALAPVALARAAAGIDLLLALLLLGMRTRVSIAAMLALVGAYTLVFGSLLPALWLEPLGGVAKNLVVLPALAVLWVLSDRR